MISIRRPPRWLSARVDAVAAHLDRLAPPPRLLARAIAKLAGGVTQLPSAPPSTLVAAAINRALWPRFPPELRDGLAGRVVAMEITDLGVRVRLCAGPRGFSAAGEQAVAALRIASRTSGWWRLARGLDDSDRLFFDRVLMMEGDTELGLLLKNSLDALGPLWPVATAQEQRRLPQTCHQAFIRSAIPGAKWFRHRCSRRLPRAQSLFPRCRRCAAISASSRLSNTLPSHPRPSMGSAKGANAVRQLL